MNEPIRKLAIVALLLVLTLMAAVSWVQVLNADKLNADSRNVRTLYREFGNFRGPFIVDGEAVVYSTPVDSPFNYLRSYTAPELYAPVTGFYSIVYGRTALERTENLLLSGEADELVWTRLSDLFSGQDQRGASIELTIRAQIQQAAAEALGDRKGAVVVIDPRDGKILAMYSSPSYDPSLLAMHNTSEVSKNYQALIEDPNQPLINRAIAGATYPPGSVFKLVVAAAALENGYAPTDMLYAPDVLPLPQTDKGSTSGA